MERERLTPELKEALLSLLDDASPGVRKEMLAHFARLGPEGLQVLQEASRSQNRVLSWHALWFLTELKFTDPVSEFKGFIRSMNYELETGSLLMSRTIAPDLDIGGCCSNLDAIAQRCRELMVEPSTLRDKCRVINRVLFHEYGFHGNVDSYTDPLNSFLDQVLARRKGIPISLSIIYLLVAQRCGVSLEPVSAPGHFLIGCFVEDRPFFIDAFEKGLFRTPDEVYTLLRDYNIVPKATDLAPTPVREVLCRCCRNLVKHYAEHQDYEHARLFAEFVDEFDATYERHAQP